MEKVMDQIVKNIYRNSCFRIFIIRPFFTGIQVCIRSLQCTFSVHLIFLNQFCLDFTKGLRVMSIDER